MKKRKGQKKTSSNATDKMPAKATDRSDSSEDTASEDRSSEEEEEEEPGKLIAKLLDVIRCQAEWSSYDESSAQSSDHAASESLTDGDSISDWHEWLQEDLQEDFQEDLQEDSQEDSQEDPPTDCDSMSTSEPDFSWRPSATEDRDDDKMSLDESSAESFEVSNSPALTDDSEGIWRGFLQKLVEDEKAEVEHKKAEVERKKAEAAWEPPMAENRDDGKEVWHVQQQTACSLPEDYEEDDEEEEEEFPAHNGDDEADNGLAMPQEKEDKTPPNAVVTIDETAQPLTAPCLKLT